MHCRGERASPEHESTKPTTINYDRLLPMQNNTGSHYTIEITQQITDSERMCFYVLFAFYHCM